MAFDKLECQKQAPTVFKRDTCTKILFQIYSCLLMFHFGHSHHYELGIRGQNISESSGL